MSFLAESHYPQYSRLWIACDRDLTEDQLREEFEKYGSIAKINLCRDKMTNTPKGFAFIQFERTSEAAAAIEGLNGALIGNSPRRLKVTVAVTKDVNTAAASDISAFLRLFLVVPKSVTEDELWQHFSQFGEVNSVNIVKDRETKESKGYAYIKYNKFLDAAYAFENCDRSFKVVFAKPKDMTTGKDGRNLGQSNEGAICAHIEDNPDGYTSLLAEVSADLLEEQIEWLFDVPPGLEYVRFFSKPSYLPYDMCYSREVFVQYDSPGTAAYALRKLNGFEYPPGKRIRVQPDYSQESRQTADRRPHGKGNSMSELMQQVENLTRRLSEATRVMKAAGLPIPLKGIQEMESFRCSVKLPPPQPLAKPNSPAEERLFLVCEPGLPPQDALWDVFGRFGNLIELYILNGKNCGYAKYASRESAQRAIQTLNGQDLYRMKMKVMVANPQGPQERKRPRITDY